MGKILIPISILVVATVGVVWCGLRSGFGSCAGGAGIRGDKTGGRILPLLLNRVIFHRVGAALRSGWRRIACSVERTARRVHARCSAFIGWAIWVELPRTLRQVRRRVLAMKRRGGRRAIETCAGPAETPAGQIDLDVLNCRVVWSRAKEGQRQTKGGFRVEICGTIRAESKPCEAVLRVTVCDVTGDAGGRQAVLGRDPAGARPGAVREFVHCAEMGRLHHGPTRLPDWTVVAQLKAESLLLPRCGRRLLQFGVSISSRDSQRRIADAQCSCLCESEEPGYVDFQENVHRARTLAVGLAFAVSAADEVVDDCEVQFIRAWAQESFGGGTQGPSERELDRAVLRTVRFFRNGGRLKAQRVCEEINRIAPAAERYQIAELCLNVARAKGYVTPEELGLVQTIAGGFCLDSERFQRMVEKILPSTIHQVKDIDTLLGIRPDMTPEAIRHKLNREYAKWSSRVTSSEPAIREQADEMIALIAGARNRYVAAKALSPA